MELTLTRQAHMFVRVACDNQTSHNCDISALTLYKKSHLSYPPSDTVAYGQMLYQALFPLDTLAQRRLQRLSASEPIRLVLTDADLDAIPWEYVYGPHGYLILEYPFLRALPSDQCIDPPSPSNQFHVVAVTSDPLEPSIVPLNIAGEWQRLKEVIQEVHAPITLEQVFPPTLEQLRRLISNQQNNVIHFMGHGNQQKTGGELLFEQENGHVHAVTAADFVRCVRGAVFLITLNSCVSATPGPDVFSNIAASLMRQKTPYVLGMRFSIADEDARIFSRIFYSELARGSSVEEAVLQVRLKLAQSQRPWAIGVPVLYTALRTAASGFLLSQGHPLLKEHRPRMEIDVLPRVEGVYHGYRDALQQLGTLLTGDDRPPLVTLHGVGGQGKTTLARVAAERFAHAWPGGVWAISLEQLPRREVFIAELAQFLGLEKSDSSEREKRVLTHLHNRRTLLILDNAETLFDAIHAGDSEAIRLTAFLRELLPRPPVGLLVTSRVHLGWSGEQSVELQGVSPDDGGKLFLQHLSMRREDVTRHQAQDLSLRVSGHPLSLCLLGAALNRSSASFEHFIHEYEAQLLSAENMYKGVDHRHHTIHACIAISIQYLSDPMHALLRGLSIFHAPFLSATAAIIFQSVIQNVEKKQQYISDSIHELWQRGLLTLEEHDALRLYQIPPVVRLFIEQNIEQAYQPETLLEQLGNVYAEQAQQIAALMDDHPATILVARQSFVDFERGLTHVQGEVRGYYLLEWGWILQRLGDIPRSKELTEQALEYARNSAHLQTLKGRALNNLAMLYRIIGQPQSALRYYEEALSTWSSIDSLSGKALTLNDMSLIYREQGQLQLSFALNEQILPLRHAIGDRRGEAITLNNLAVIHEVQGRPHQALELHEQSLRISREIGDRQVESTALTNMALIYQQTGNTERALKLYKQALLLRQTIGSLVGEAEVLNNLSEVYRITGQVQA